MKSVTNIVKNKHPKDVGWKEYQNFDSNMSRAIRRMNVGERLELGELGIWERVDARQHHGSQMWLIKR